MSAFNEFYYAEQMRNYLIQFMSVFANMQVRVGANDDKTPRLMPVEVFSGSKDRVVAAIKGENTQNKPIKLPIMSAHLTSMDLAPERVKGKPNNRRNTFLETGGLYPDDIKVVEQRMPVPYNATYELSMWASNQDQHYQLLEQILMLFNPSIQIQSSDEPFDWTKLYKIELKNISLDEGYPAGPDRRMIQTTLSFEVGIWLSVPADVHSRYVQDIYLRVGAVSQAANTPEQMVAELDSQGINYDLVFSLSDIDITESE